MWRARSIRGIRLEGFSERPPRSTLQPMKSIVARPQPQSQALKKAVKANGLSPDQVKARASRVSASSRNPAVDDVRQSFGFMPVGIQGVVIHWPAL